MSSRARSYGASPWPSLIEHSCSNSYNIGSRPVGLSFFHVNTGAAGKQRLTRMGDRLGTCDAAGIDLNIDACQRQ